MDNMYYPNKFLLLGDLENVVMCAYLCVIALICLIAISAATPFIAIFSLFPNTTILLIIIFLLLLFLIILSIILEMEVKEIW